MIPYLKKLKITLYSQILPQHTGTHFLFVSVSARPFPHLFLTFRAAVSLQLGPPRCATLIPQLLSPLTFTVTACAPLFWTSSLPSFTACVHVCSERGRQLLALHVPVKLWQQRCVCGESKAADSLIRGGVFNGQLSLPFTTCQPEKNFIIPSPHRSVFFLQHCSGHFSHYITITIHFPDLVRLIRILKYII